MDEQDLLIEVFSEDLGKIQCIAKSAAKISSKLSGKLNPLNVISLQLFKGKSFYTITDVSITENLSSIRDHFNNLQWALFFVSVIRLSTEYKQKQKSLYTLLYQCLKQLNENRNLKEIKTFFYEHYLTIEGIMPPLVLSIDDKLFLNTVQAYIEKPLRAPLAI
jgi:DNA repair protein RecO (recombination protein O)